MAYDQLDPTTKQKLRELARRRRALLVLRALFAGVLTLLGAMALVALADRLIVLGQAARIALSLSAYLAVVVIVYLVSLRYLLRMPTLPTLARLIESAEPALREDLVSAVELAQDSASMYDSPAFREVLQRNVARRVANVDADRVLPWKLVAWWAGVSTGAVVVTIALIMTPGLRYGDLLTRAMLPTAELDRVSDVRITLLSPELDESGRVPMNADLPVKVRVTGGSFDDVVIELVDHTGKRDDLQMRQQAKSNKRFAADVPVGDRPMRFRVRAGDGRTRYYELDPTARPAVTRFSQVVHPPDYTGWDPQRKSGRDGAIDALTGSVVDLTLTANQPIKTGRLVLELPDGEEALPLYIDPADATVLKTALPIQASGTYRVELVAMQTAFANDDARRHEITAKPDGLPTVALTSPKGTTGEANDALVRLLGRAGDDVGLREVAREVRINGGDWSRALVSVDGRGGIALPMDLLPMNLREDDEVELRLSATDLAGNTAASATARVVVTPHGYELASAQSAADLRALLTSVGRAIDSADQAKQRYQQATAGGRGNDAIARRRTQTQALIGEATLRDELERARQSVIGAFESTRGGSDADLVMRIGRTIAEAQMLGELSPVTLDDDAAMQDAVKSAERARGVLQSAQADLRPRVAALESAVIVQQGSVLEADLAGLIDRAAQDRGVDQTLAQQRMHRRTELAGAQTDELLKRIVALGKREDDVKRYRDRFDESAQSLGQTLGNYNATLKRGPEFDTMLEVAGGLRDALADTDARVWPAWVYLADQDRDQQRRQDKPIRLDADAIATLRQHAGQPAMGDVVGPVIDRLRNRAAMEEARPSPDNAFVALTGVAATALEQVAADAGVHAKDDTLKRIDSIHHAYRTIERVQTLVELRAMVVTLAKGERAGESASRLPLEHRLDWSAIAARFNAVERTLQQDKALRDSAKRVRDAQRSDAAQRVEQAFNTRRQIDPQPEPMHAQLDAIARLLSEALDAAAPALAEARSALSAQTPSLTERMRALAERAEQLSAVSKQAAKQAEQAPEPEVVNQAEQLTQQQQSINAALDALKEEMRREANRQDLLTEQGRELARDFDDAIAMLKPDAEQATNQLDLAKRPTTHEHERPDAIAAAAQAQQATAETLNELAEHFDQAQQQQPDADASRQDLRQMEQKLGIAEQLNAQYERMKRLAELAELNDQERLAQLEAQLKQDRGMQRELDRIADDLAQRAQQRLEDAAREEQALADQLNQTQQQQQGRADPTELAIDAIAGEAGRLERDRVRPLAQQAERGAPQAKPDIDRSRQALDRAAQQAQADNEQAQAQGAAQEQRERAQALAESTRQAADALKQAAADAKAEEQSAKDRHRDAKNQVDNANRQGEGAPEAAREVIESARQQERASGVREEADDVARRADDLAKRADALDKQAQRDTAQADAQREQGAADQAKHAAQAGQAAQELDRAARHEQRLGDPLRADALDQSAEQTRELAEQTLPKAGEDIGKQAPLDEAEQAARQAEKALRDQAKQIEDARQAKSEQSESPTKDPAQQGDGQQPDREPQEQNEQGEREQSDGEQGDGEQGDGEQGQGEQADREDRQQEQNPAEQDPQGPGEQADPGSNQEAQGEQGDSSRGEGQQTGEGEGQSPQGPGEQGQGEQSQGEQGLSQQGQGEQGENSQAQGEQGDSPQDEGQQPAEGESAPQAPGLLPGPLPPAVAQELSRELDQLDAKLNRPPAAGQQPNGQDPQQGEAQPGEGQQAKGDQGEGQGEGQGQGEQAGQAQQGESQGQGQGQGAGQGQAQGQGETPPGSRPIDAAAQAQAQAIRDARMGEPGDQPGGQPGQQGGQANNAMAQGQESGKAGSGQGNGSTADSDFNPDALDGEADDGRRAWGDLPPRIVEDLSRGQRERAPAEYLDQVDAYFRAIARKSREQSDE